MTNPGPRFPADPSAEVRTQAPRRPELDPIRYTAKTGSGSRTVSSLPYTSRNGLDNKGVRIGASGPLKQPVDLSRKMLTVGKATHNNERGYWRRNHTEFVHAHCRHCPVKGAAQPAATGNAQARGTGVGNTTGRARARPAAAAAAARTGRTRRAPDRYGYGRR